MCKMLNMHMKKMKILLISPEIKLFIFKRLYDYIILFQFFTFTEYFSGLSTKIFDISCPYYAMRVNESIKDFAEY